MSNEARFREVLDLHDYIGENMAGRVGCSGCTWVSTLPARQLTRVQRVASHRSHVAAVLAALPQGDTALVKAALHAAADEMEAVIADGDVAEVAAPVPGEVGRGACVAARDALYEDPAGWLREYTITLLSDAHPGDDEGERYPRVQGLCPRCDGASLFLGDGGYVTCSWVECSNPTSASELLGVKFPAARDAGETTAGGEQHG